MADNKRIRNIKSNYERVIQGLITGLKQFYYVDTGGYVKPDSTYSINYMQSKNFKIFTDMDYEDDPCNGEPMSDVVFINGEDI